jgi:hypothetical protein
MIGQYDAHSIDGSCSRDLQLVDSSAGRKRCLPCPVAMDQCLFMGVIITVLPALFKRSRCS